MVNAIDVGAICNDIPAGIQGLGKGLLQPHSTISVMAALKSGLHLVADVHAIEKTSSAFLNAIESECMLMQTMPKSLVLICTCVSTTAGNDLIRDWTATDNAYAGDHIVVAIKTQKLCSVVASMLWHRSRATYMAMPWT